MSPRSGEGRDLVPATGGENAPDPAGAAARELLVLEPVFDERPWGGTRLRTWFGEAMPNRTIGECWTVSAMPNKSGLVRDAGPARTLRQAWAAGAVTGRAETAEFPLLCKFLDANDWLSVQVHPDDTAARELEGQPWGKTECWLVVACEDGAEIILGHTARSRRELQNLVRRGSLMPALTRVPVAPGDFFFVPAGTIHALGPGILMYEVQQSSDITYRLFDFNRNGPDGRKRPLHIDKALSVVAAPDRPQSPPGHGQHVPVETGAVRQDLVRCPQFDVARLDLSNGTCNVTRDGFWIVTVIRGSGQVSTVSETCQVAAGLSLIVPAGTSTVQLSGDLSVVLAEPGPDARGARPLPQSP